MNFWLFYHINPTERKSDMSLALNTSYLRDFVAPAELEALEPYVETAHRLLHSRTGQGSDFLGWLELGQNRCLEDLARIQAAARQIQKDSQVLVVIGIGGSYLGARAALDFLRSPNYNALPKDTPDILFAGNTLSPDALNETLELCKGKDISLNVVSKSGTTIEPALAFRVFRDLVEKKYGKEGARKRIYCTTDKAKGNLKSLADREGYQCFVIPDDVGGRYSVLTPVGLLPIAVAGCDVQALLDGCAAAERAYANPKLSQNDAYHYAAIRNILARKGKVSEVLVSYEPAFVMLGEWYKQLFGESEGKNRKGLYPTSMCFSTDLHSLGQYVQDGSPILFETVLSLKRNRRDFYLEPEAEDFDGLNFAAGQNLSAVNHKAFMGTLLAHVQGGVPNLVVEIEDRSEYTFGYLVHFFEKACAMSGYLLGVNPFDQPGVQNYKTNMFALLGKPGFEEQRKQLEQLLSDL